MPDALSTCLVSQKSVKLGMEELRTPNSLGHCHERSNLVQIEQHSQLGHGVSKYDSNSWLVADFGPLAKDRESGKEVIPRKSLKQLGRTNDPHQRREECSCNLPKKYQHTRDVDILDDIDVVVERLPSLG